MQVLTVRRPDKAQVNTEIAWYTFFYGLQENSADLPFITPQVVGYQVDDYVKLARLPGRRVSPSELSDQIPSLAAIILWLKHVTVGEQPDLRRVSCPKWERDLPLVLREDFEQYSAGLVEDSFLSGHLLAGLEHLIFAKAGQLGSALEHGDFTLENLIAVEGRKGPHMLALVDPEHASYRALAWKDAAEFFSLCFGRYRQPGAGKRFLSLLLEQIDEREIFWRHFKAAGALHVLGELQAIRRGISSADAALYRELVGWLLD